MSTEDKKTEGTIERVESTELTETIPLAPAGVTAVIGHSRLGPVGVVQACQSESEYNRHFGDFEEGPVLAAAVQGFFQNGGNRCVVLNLGETLRTLAPGDLEPLEREPDIELVCAPGKTEPAEHEALITHCNAKGTRLALLDGPAELPPSFSRLQPPTSQFAAYYLPWLLAHDPVQSRVVRVPPSGHMAGLMARVAQQRGVHKAPANEPLFGITGLSREFTQAEQDFLHPRRINCIRRLPKIEGIRPWGAQTLADRAPFQSIATFRVYSLVVRSIEDGSAWAVGSESEPALWQHLLDAVRALLTEVWQSGALAGETADQAFRLRCDADLNDASRRNSGLVHLEIGLAFGRPNAFYTFQMGLDLVPF